MNPKTKDCSRREFLKLRRVIEALLLRMVDTDTCPLTKEMRKRIISRLYNVTFRCYDCKLNPDNKKPTKTAAGWWSAQEKTIYICKNQITTKLILHELIHAINGTELDAEAIENHCYRKGKPTKLDYDKFIRKGKKWGKLILGRYVIWNPETGEKWINAGTLIKPKKGTPLKKNPKTPDDVLKKYKESLEKKKKVKKTVKKTAKKPKKKQ